MHDTCPFCQSFRVPLFSTLTVASFFFSVSRSISLLAIYLPFSCYNPTRMITPLSYLLFRNNSPPFLTQEEKRGLIDPYVDLHRRVPSFPTVRNLFFPSSPLFSLHPIPSLPPSSTTYEVEHVICKIILQYCS